MIERSATEIAAAVNGRQASAVEVLDAQLAQVERVEPSIGAFLSATADLARRQALLVDEAVAAGRRLPLAGVPLAVKDNMCLSGTVTTAGSRILEHWVAPYTATAVQRLLDAGCVPVGKANLDEFAMGSSCENSALGVTRNPWDLRRVPGGSSGGSVAAVAAREAALATASDTGGSIREPAAFCGVVGMKPTYGRVSRYGLIAFASSLDQIGPIARTVEDAAAMYDVMAGHDPMDATSLPRPVEPTATALRGDLRGVRVGLVREFDTKGLGQEIDALYRRAYEKLAALGAEVVEVALPHAEYGLATYYLIAPAEASSNLARFDGVRYGLRVEGANVQEMYAKTRAAGFGPEVKRRILIGTYALSSGYYDAYYVRAQKARTLMAADFEQAFAQCDLIACPAASSAAFEFGAKGDDPVAMYLMDFYTIPMSLAGVPALSVPCGFVRDGESELPMGLQLVAPLYQEARLFAAAHAYEQATRFTLDRAPASLEGVR
ncbi:MAG TPA: Asp-tRNA(Asn)/Glu-tRNA(Gln) amidotransferase subunit GatA [Candidatus Dormibacteraeota bacterium]|nr:Asp-tRNA(Asn)/Glu-tRNA(Gln) amidotransferase subunit GatA [Candidatus Dormibacteraeota bacterium]